MTTYDHQRRTEAIDGNTVAVGDPVTIESNYNGEPVDHPATIVEIDDHGNIFVDVDHGDGVTQKRMRV